MHINMSLQNVTINLAIGGLRQDIVKVGNGLVSLSVISVFTIFVVDWCVCVCVQCAHLLLFYTLLLITLKKCLR